MIKQLTEEDVPAALEFRRLMMTESGVMPLLAEDWRELTEKLYTDGYRQGSIAHFGWYESGLLAGTAGVMIRDDFPFFTFKARRYGWIMDVYVIPEYRRRGIAGSLTRHTLDWLRAKGITFARLSASEQARQAQLYEKMGFIPSNEMRLRMDPAPGT